MYTLDPRALTEFSTALLVAVGATEPSAATVSEALVRADLSGHASHGVMRLARYVAAVHEGSLLPRAEPRVEFVHGAVGRVDGAWGFGQVAGCRAAILAQELAEQNGVGAVSLVAANHIGRLGDYVERLAQEGYLGIAMTGGGRPGGAVAPYGGSERMFGTNPIAWGVPRAAPHDPLVIDFATAQAAEGKLAVAREAGASLPAGWLVDEAGAATLDPADFYAGGALLPFGGHKGFALTLAIDVMANALSGTPSPSSPDCKRAANPTLVVALRVAAFTDSDRFLEDVEALLTRIESSRPADGFKSVRVPGSRAAQERRTNSARGVPIARATWRALQVLADELGVEVPAVGGAL